MCVQFSLVLLLLAYSIPAGESGPRNLDRVDPVQNSLDGGGESRSEEPEYEKALTRAFCKAKCMVGESIPRLDPYSLFLTNPSTCVSQRCLACEQCVKGQGTSDACGSDYDLPSFCVHLWSKSQSSASSPSVAGSSPMTHATTTRDALHFSDFMSPKPLFHCSQKYADNITFNAAFRFEYEDQGADDKTNATMNTTFELLAKRHPQVLLNFTSWTPNSVPRVFVIRNELAGRVSYVISENWMYMVEISERTNLTLSVTAVSASTIYKQSPLTTIQLQDSPHRAGGKPRNLRVVQTRLVNASSTLGGPGGQHLDPDYHSDDRTHVDDNILNQMDLEVVVHWESGSGLDATCTYGLWCLHDNGQKEESKTPERAFWAVLDKKQMETHAKFGAKLTIDVVEVLEQGREENSTSIIYVLPSCLDFLNGDFMKCAPPPVPNLRGHLEPDGCLTLDWDPPIYNPAVADNSNTTRHLATHKHDAGHVKIYSIGIQGIDIQGLPHGHLFPTISVPGNTTHFERKLNLSDSTSLPAMGSNALGGASTGVGSAGSRDVPESFLITVLAQTHGGPSKTSKLKVRADAAPPPVPNLRGHLEPDGFLTLDWDPPIYNPAVADNSNTTRHLATHKHDAGHVKMYRIDIHGLPHGKHGWEEVTVPGNTTHFERQLNISASTSLAASTVVGSAGSVDVPESFLIAVRATRRCSTSKASKLILRADAVQSSSFIEKLSMTIGLIFGMILLVVGAFLVKNCFQKHQRKKSNREYFETLSLNGGEIPQVDSLRHAEMAATLVQETFLQGYKLTKWEISNKNLLLKEEIGRGAFGIVRRGLLYEHGKERPVAVKIPRNISGVSGENETKKFWEEFEILKGLGKHVHIVGLIGVLASKPYLPPSLVVEYCQGGDLKSHLTKHCRYRPLNNDTTLTEPGPEDADDNDPGTENEVGKKRGAASVFLVTNETYGLEAENEERKRIYDLTALDLISYARQVACGMEFLATNKIVHRDLAARNVLVGIDRTDGLERGLPKRTLKISDFGLSRDIYEQNLYKRSSEGLIPIKWLALECLFQGVYTSKSDVWSFGILLWEIVTLGGNPYPGVENTNIYQMLKEGYRMPKPSNCPDSLYELMQNCWDVNPSKRPDFSQLKADLDQKMASSADLNYLNLDNTGIHEPPKEETKTDS